MAKVFAANSSGVLVDNEPVEGVRGIDYQLAREQFDVAALGTNERVAVYYGMSRVRCRLRVASASPKLDGLAATGAMFQVVANLKHGEAARSVAFDDCFMESKDFAMNVSGHGETVYAFTATRVREEDS
jgi:hypothetical protein